MDADAEIQVLSRFTKRLHVQIDDWQSRIYAGRFAGWDTYQRACGVLEGLLDAQTTLSEVMDEWEKQS